MNLQTLTPPSGEPLSLADAKAFARIGSDHDDTLVTQLIAAARARIEAETGLALMSRTLRLTLTDWPLGVLESGGLRFPKRPAHSLIAVRLTDGETSEDVTDRFQLETGLASKLVPVPFGGWIWPRSSHEYIEIDWVAGFGAVVDVPEDLVHAMKIIVAHEFGYRDGADYSLQDDLKARLDEALSPWREVRI